VSPGRNAPPPVKDVTGSKTLRSAFAGFGATAGLLAAWGLFESQWVELRETEIPIPGLVRGLDGLRIVHLSDFHLGTLSLNGRALARAVEWTLARDPDLVLVTGDLVSRRRGKPGLEHALRTLAARRPVFAVLGNHDIDESRDPFSEATDLSDIDRRAGAVLLGDEARTIELRGVPVQIAGVDPSSYLEGRSRPAERSDPDARLRILLCHFPDVVDRLPEGAYHLVLGGHYHGGQICLPGPRGKIRLEHLRAQYWEGLFLRPAAALHVSRGLGASFVPFRLLARPDATELTLKAAE